MVAGVVIVAAVFLLLPLFRTTAVRGVQTKNLSTAKQLATGCKVYASDHEGRFPIHLSELEPDYIPDVAAMQCAIVRDGKDTGEKVDWLYFGAGFSEGQSPSILIASPQMMRPKKPRDKNHGKRVYIEGDLTGQVGTEADYQILLVETVRQMKALDSARRSSNLPTPPAPAP